MASPDWFVGIDLPYSLYHYRNAPTLISGLV
jgi:hypothetical protein